MTRKKGFTLIEILIVISLLAILTTVGFTSYQRQQRSARDTRRKADLENIRVALELYRSNTESYPNALALLVPNYMQTVPTPPSPPVGGTYIYAATPVGCTTTCTSYTIRVTLESGGTVTLTPNTIQ